MISGRYRIVTVAVPVMLLVFSLLVPRPLHAEVQIRMRSSEEAGRIRLVLEGDERVIGSARVFHSYSLVKVEFEDAFTFEPGRVPESVDISHKGNSLFISIAGLRDMKAFRLPDPPRLVIDATVSEPGKKETAEPEAETKPELDDLVVVIDPGHGGYSIGLMGSDYREKDVVLAVARSLRYAAKKAGGKVYLTRYSDKYVSIGERVVTAFERSPALFLSIHMSSTPDFVIYYAAMEGEMTAGREYALEWRQLRHVNESRRLAVALKDRLGDRFRRRVSIRRVPLPILSSIDAPAVFIEIPDGRFMDYSGSVRYGIVNAILRGIEEYER